LTVLGGTEQFAEEAFFCLIGHVHITNKVHALFAVTVFDREPVAVKQDPHSTPSDIEALVEVHRGLAV
jgi:hypothetical protein